MNQIILKPKLVLPSVEEDLWENNNLLFKYNRVMKYPLTIVEARTGSGKTTTLAYFLSKYHSKNNYFYHLKIKDKGLELFWRSMMSSFDFIEKEDIDLLNFLLIKIKKKEGEIEDVIDYFINRLSANLKEDTIFLLDDFHQIIGKNDILDSLNYFIGVMPNEFHLIISSRMKVDLPIISRLKVKRKVQLITDKDFKLNKDQIKEMYKQQYKVELDEETSKEIFELTEGWLLALDFIGDKIYVGLESEIILAESLDFELIFDYFGYEIMEGIKGEDRDFLYKTSVLEYLNIDICNQFMEVENSKAIINKLKAKGVFISEDDQGKYKYHPIFKKFLLEEANRTYDLNVLYKRVARIYEKNNDLLAKVNALIKSKNQKELLELVKSQGALCMEVSENKVLTKALDALPLELYYNNPILYIYKGDILRGEKRYHEAIRAYNKGDKLIENYEDGTSLIYPKCRILSLYCFFGSSKAEDYALGIKDYNCGRCSECNFIYFQAIVGVIKGKIQNIDQILKNIDQSTNKYYEIKVNYLFIRGKIDEALSLYKYSGLEEVKVNDLLLFRTLFIPVIIYFLRGEYNQAKAYIWSKFKFEDGIVKLFANYYLQLINFSSKSIEKKYIKDSLVMNFIDRFKECPFSVSGPKLQVIINTVSMNILCGEYDKAIAYAQKGLIEVEKKGDVYSKGILLNRLGKAYCFKEEFKGAINAFKKSIGYFEKVDNKRLLICSNIGLSAVYYQLEDNKRFKNSIKSALKLASLKSAEYIIIKKNPIFIKDQSVIFRMLLKAKKEGIEVDYVSDFLKSFGLEGLSYHPGYSLRVKTFGGLEVYAGDKKILEEKWTRKKSKELLMILLANYGNAVCKDILCNQLWPDKDYEIAERNFYVALSTLNKVLEPNRGKKEDPVFIVKKGTTYRVSNSFLVDYDVQKFKELVKIGRRTDDIYISIKFYEEAIDLYNDGFLPSILYQESIIKEKDRLELIYLDIINISLDYYYSIKKYDKVIELADKAIKVDNYFEDAYLYKMKSYEKTGMRTRAVKIYNKLVEILANDLNLKPRENIKKFYINLTK
ncbi:BTAD domain-containing putative transcriptional regulator [Halonatronum saccharophilum]|uniref:BTAD domain-containing putative transcriptional regulator n=1 Tax=Halonatronum saccharophilum TaxID=150060 RepID=UPI000482B8C6|nr:BTAD domain-containing putative transcriptional regulator [Halonatronum saccharophilum]